VFGIVIGWHVLGMLILIFVRFSERSADVAKVTAQLAEGEGPKPVRN